eukprot:2382175-Rhodomonas_salina.1
MIKSQFNTRPGHSLIVSIVLKRNLDPPVTLKTAKGTTSTHLCSNLNLKHAKGAFFLDTMRKL